MSTSNIIKINRTVSMSEMTLRDLRYLDCRQMKQYATFAHRMIRELQKQLKNQSKQVLHRPATIDADTFKNEMMDDNDINEAMDLTDHIDIDDDGNALNPKKRFYERHADVPVGNKRGKTSKYHYTFYNRAIGAWQSAVLIDGKKFTTGNHETEISAAKAIDDLLDQLHDEKRPRNRDEFKEDF